LKQFLLYWKERGRDLDDLDPGERIFPVSGTGFAKNLKRYGAKAGLPDIHVHALRHASAKLRREAGSSLEDVQQHLGHANLATTARYLAQLEGQRDTGWAGPAAALGLL
jgi:site-specific recombinase XerD